VALKTRVCAAWLVGKEWGNVFKYLAWDQDITLPCTTMSANSIQNSTSYLKLSGSSCLGCQLNLTSNWLLGNPGREHLDSSAKPVERDVRFRWWVELEPCMNTDYDITCMHISSRLQVSYRSTAYFRYARRLRRTFCEKSASWLEWRLRHVYKKRLRASACHSHCLASGLDGMARFPLMHPPPFCRASTRQLWAHVSIDIDIELQQALLYHPSYALSSCMHLLHAPAATLSLLICDSTTYGPMTASNRSPVQPTHIVHLY